MDSAWPITPISTHIEGHFVDFKALGKICITPERNRLARSALHRSKENHFLYRMVILEVKTEREIFSEYRMHHFIEDSISVFMSKRTVQKFYCFLTFGPASIFVIPNVNYVWKNK